MSVELKSEQLWEIVEKELFAVLGMVTADCEARTVGIVYVVRNRRLYIATGRDTWKVRHVTQNPHVSLTVPVHKSIPLMPWFKILAATITFCGEAAVLDPAEVPQETIRAIIRGLADDPDLLADYCIIEVTPEKDFITYGIGIPLIEMRDPKQARGRAPVDVSV